MTDPVLQLAPSELAIAPGAQGRTTIVVENVGSKVEEFRLELLGAAAAWASAEPGALEVYPGSRQEAVIAFSVPSVGAVPSGSYGLGVRAVSLVDHYSADVAEGSVEVGPVSGLATSLTPVTSGGRWKGRHTLTISNWGNTPAAVRLAASDPDERLGFLLRPTQLDLPLGATRTARITVRTRRPSLRSAQQRLPFTVVGEPVGPVLAAPAPQTPDTERPVVDGAFLQRPILGRGLVGAVALLAVAGAAAAALLLRDAERTAPELTTGFSLAAPTGAQATAASSSTIRLTWEPVPSAVTYRVVEVDPADRTQAVRILEPVAGELGAVEVPELGPVTEHCFTVAAVSAAGTTGRPTEPVCATTPVPTGNGDLPGAAQWIALRAAFNALGNPSAEPSARAERARLAAAEGIQPGVLDSGPYPQLQQATAGRAWIVYEGPFDAQADAQAVCTRKPSCRAVAAGARQDAAAPPAPAPPAPPAPVPPAPAPLPTTPPSAAPTIQPSAGPTPTNGATSAPSTPEPSPTS